MYFELHIDVKKFVCGGWVVHLDYNISSGPFLSFDIGVGPGPKLDNIMKQQLLCKVWLCSFEHCMTEYSQSYPELNTESISVFPIIVQL